MARKIIEQLVSDLSGDVLPEGKGQTVDFSYRGTSYQIDLTDKEAAGFDKSIAVYLEHATKVRGNARTSTKRSGAASSKHDLADIREWARANGHEVSERGRIKRDLVEAYEAAK